jgi:hypothetical protein
MVYNKFIPVLFFISFAQDFGTNDFSRIQSKDKDQGSITIGLKHSLPTQLRESSGLCYTNGNLWTFGDGGNPNEIYKIDTSSGAILQTVKISNYPNIDWEDITSDSQYIYVGDFGNNHGNRKDLKIIRIRKGDLNNPGSNLKIDGEAISFNYEDQSTFSNSSKSNYDCESFISVGKYLYLFTKDALDFKTRCYKISNKPGSYSILPISTFDTKGKITGAAYNIETKEIVLLGYMNKKIFSFVWFLNEYKGDQFFTGNKVRINFGSDKDWQTEGIDYISKDRLFMSCETSASQKASLYFMQKN